MAEPGQLVHAALQEAVHQVLCDSDKDPHGRGIGHLYASWASLHPGEKAVYQRMESDLRCTVGNNLREILEDTASLSEDDELVQAFCNAVEGVNILDDGVER